ncbi:endo-alpha-1,4-polygalactosaminidase (GH114 family) [Wenyingzhuangia heitensis]|uniref:Endo-alpha-1,4-polygalactosaminidase (GH114 family) n=1 Tax=Wenyingzhuangia heitensis TaxID=1487859 RepID=A0ABX0U9F7_9FLAO|nr:endo alpha-1,4 polygalactosaminidase [Wenyingzhuangia heitensis]NIJ45463.1 endo-alpha-1,4-polygalactosaminidase (GH114 family) [Wenyingzhuangia heitensis]
MLTMFSSVFGVNKPDFFISYENIPPYQIKGFDTVFLESAFYNSEDVASLKKENKNVYAYISLTEVSEHNIDLYNKLKPYLLSKNETWNSYYINIADARARKIVLNEIKLIYKKGFDGLLLDNLDNVSIHGPYKALQSALIKLILEIKEQFYNKELIQNGGLFLLNKTHAFLKGILVESVYTNYDFNSQLYQLRNKREALQKKSNLENSIKHYNLKGFVIEYAVDKKIANKIYKHYRSSKLAVVVTDINLSNNLQ